MGLNNLSDDILVYCRSQSSFHGIYLFLYSNSGNFFEKKEALLDPIFTIYSFFSKPVRFTEPLLGELLYI